MTHDPEPKLGRVLSFRFVSFKHPDSPLSGLISPSGDPATRLSLRSSLSRSARFRLPPSSFKLRPSSIGGSPFLRFLMFKKSMAGQASFVLLQKTREGL